MTVKDVINELKDCECTIRGLNEMLLEAAGSESDTLQDAASIIVKYVDELEKKQIK